MSSQPCRFSASQLNLAGLKALSLMPALTLGQIRVVGGLRTNALSVQVLLPVHQGKLNQSMRYQAWQAELRAARMCSN